MTSYLLTLLLLGGSPPIPAAAQPPESVEQIVTADKWALAEGSHNDLPLIVRYRTGFEKKPVLTAYPNLVHVVWRYAPSANGLPSHAEGDAMATFEDRLIRAVEPNRAAALVAVLTNGGTREWVFYARQTTDFGQVVTSMPQDTNAYPVVLSMDADPQWSMLYDNILSGLSN